MLDSDISTNINTGGDYLTVVNLLTPPLDAQNQLIELLQRGMIEEMSLQPGFIASNIHRSLDSNHVLVYAQWESPQALQSAAEKVGKGEAPSMAAAYALGNPQYHSYEVVSIHRASN